MKSSDWIAKRIKSEVSTIFGVTGGAIVNLFDSLDKVGLRIIPMHHEQSAAMAADAYARIMDNLGVCVATSGPGATNLVTGTCCSWFDSIPVLTIAGQVPVGQLKINDVRQYGFQETDTVSLFQSITKSSIRVTDIVGDFNRSINIAKTPRKGPVFLELCDDIQRQDIPCTDYQRIDKTTIYEDNRIDTTEIVNLLKKSKRPLLIIGNGFKQAKGKIGAIKFIEQLNMPTLLTWGAMDLLPHDHHLNLRDFGITAQRANNFAISIADLILVLGARLDTHEAGDYTKFAPNATKIIVDVDQSELAIHSADLHIKVDIKNLFIDYCGNWNQWLENIRSVQKEYPIVPATCKGEVNPHFFFDQLSNIVPENWPIITDTGQTLTWTMQAWKVKRGQHLFSAFNHTPMGYSLPASIGAFFASNQPVVAVMGDGGIMMNLQELAVISLRNIPIKIIIIENGGYGMMMQTQDTWLGGRHVASSERGGVLIPNFKRISNAFGIRCTSITKHNQVIKLNSILNSNNPEIVVVRIPKGTPIEPKMLITDDLDHCYPYIDQKKIDQSKKILLC